MNSTQVTHDRDWLRATIWLTSQYLSDARVRGLGPGYGAVAGSPGATVKRFQEDAEHRLAGSFTRLKLALPDEWTERVASLDSRAIEARLLRAAELTLSRELPRYQGVLAVHFTRPEARPEVHALLSPRLEDGGRAPLLLRADMAAIESRWDSNLQRTLGPRPLPEIADREPQVEKLRGELREATERFADVVSSRFRGEVGQDVVKDAGERAHAAQDALARALAPPAPVAPEIGQRAQYATVQLRVEGGRTFLDQLAPKDRDLVLDRAVRATLPSIARDFKVVHWPEGRDQRVSVLLDLRRQPDRADPAYLGVLRAGIANDLSRQLGLMAQHYDSLGRGEALQTPGRTLAVEPPVPAQERPTAPQGERDAHEHPVDRAYPRPALAIERTWPETGPVHNVRIQLARGAEFLDKLPAEQRQAALMRAVDHAFPFIDAPGLRPNFTVRTEGRSLELNVRIPVSVGLSKANLHRPLYEFRFARELQRAVLAHGGLREGLEPLRTGAGHGATRVAEAVARVTGDKGRGALPSPDREVRQSAWERLSQAVPAPVRAAVGITRFIGGLRERE